MKYLSDYMQAEQTVIFNKYEAFFAFSNSQFDEAKKEGVKYVRLDCGLICPKEHVETMYKDIEDCHKRAIAQDIAENGIKGIIWREFANYECQISEGWTGALGALADYPVTHEEIQAEWKGYWNHCVEHDFF